MKWRRQCGFDVAEERRALEVRRREARSVGVRREKIWWITSEWGVRGQRMSFFLFLLYSSASSASSSEVVLRPIEILGGCYHRGLRTWGLKVSQGDAARFPVVSLNLARHSNSTDMT